MADEIRKAKDLLSWHIRTWKNSTIDDKSQDQKILNVRRSARRLAKVTERPITDYLPEQLWNKKEQADRLAQSPEGANRAEYMRNYRKATRENMSEDERLAAQERMRKLRASRAERQKEKLTRDKEFMDLQANRDERTTQHNLKLESDLQLLILHERETVHTVRETWLTSFIDASRYLFEMNGYQLPDKIKISVGFPHIGAKGKRLGECWSNERNGGYNIFISPLLDEPAQIGPIVTHELCHAAVGLKAGHNKTFAKCAYTMGLEGKPRSTTPGPLWHQMHADVVAALGDFPHYKLEISNFKKPGSTRMIKCECTECGMIFRTTRKYLEDTTHLQCPLPTCGNEIKIDLPAEEPEETEAVQEPPVFKASK